MPRSHRRRIRGEHRQAAAGDGRGRPPGAGAAAALPSWQRPEVVLRRTRLAVMGRPGVERAAVEAAVGEVHWLDTPLLDISGTLLRARGRAARSLRFLAPGPVLDYIESAGLYTDG